MHELRHQFASVVLSDKEGAPAQDSLIPTTAYVRPCAAIAPEALAGHDGIFLTLGERYGALTDELPLAGAAVMTTNSFGEIALIARLRAAAPWLEPAIAVIEQQLRVQNWRAGRGSPGGRSA